MSNETVPQKCERTLARINNDFASHQVDDWSARVMAEARGRIKDVAAYLVLNVPEGRELSTALTKLEEAMFWANAGIARPGVAQ